MHLGQSSACNQDYENLVFLIFLNKWSMYRWLEMYSDMVLLCSVFLTHWFFPPCKSDWFQILSVALVAKKSAKLLLLISKLCSSSFREKILIPRHCNCQVLAHFNDLLFWFFLLTTCNYKRQGLWGPWEGKIQIRHKRGKGNWKRFWFSFRLLQDFTVRNLPVLWMSEAPSAPVIKALFLPQLLSGIPQRQPKETQHIQGKILKSGYSEKIWQTEEGPSVSWLCTCVVGKKKCQRHRGIRFVSKVLLQRNRHPCLSLRKALCGRLCGPSYNAMTEKPVFNWSFTENAQSR